MRELIYNNRTLTTFSGLLLVLIILYFLFKKLPTTSKKKEKSNSKKEEKKAQNPVKQKEEVAQKKEEPQVEIPATASEEKTQNKDENSKKADKKAKIVQIYKRERKPNSEESKTKSDPIYDRNVEFVNVSKNVAKFKSFAENNNDEDLQNIDEKDEFGFTKNIDDECEFCENNVKHFDHSRRLSSVMKDENHDDMFASHISDKYMNINSEKHLNLDSDFEKLLFSRAEELLNNSAKLGFDEGGQSLFYSSNGFGDGQSDEFDDEKINVNMKTALIAETYFNRKKKK